jgi:Phasin protein
VASAQQTAGSIEERGATVRAGARDIRAKAISFAENDVRSSLDYAQSLLQAKDMAEVMRLHGDYYPGPDARADRAGERDGPDRHPGNDGSSQACRAQGLEKDADPLAVQGWDQPEDERY